MEFVKYHGLGNDFILIDGDVESAPLSPEFVRQICDRNFGVGADGVVVTKKIAEKSFEMRIFNSDGSECEMCGNATRCVAKHLNIAGVIELNTLCGVIRPELLDSGLVRVDMGVPEVGESVTLNNFAGTCVSMGNPHFVTFVENFESFDLTTEGSKLEVDPFFPNKCNIEFVQVLSPDSVRMRVWERGCGITLACGTGSCATVVAGVVTGRLANNVTVKLDGGELEIAWDKTTGRIYMSGPAQKVFTGTI